MKHTSSTTSFCVTSRVAMTLLILVCGYALGFLSFAAVFWQQVQITVKHNWQIYPNATYQRSYTDVWASDAAPSGAPLSPTNITATNTVHCDGSLPPPKTSTSRKSTSGVVHHSAQGLVSHAELDHVAAEGTKACDKGAAKGLKLNLIAELVAPLVVLGHNRVGYLAHCLMMLLTHWSKDPANAMKFPLFVSIDGGDQRSLNMALAFKEMTGVQVISRLRHPTSCSNGDCHLTAHYKFMLQLFFQCLRSPRLILLEEDLEVTCRHRHLLVTRWSTWWIVVP